MATYNMLLLLSIAVVTSASVVEQNAEIKLHGAVASIEDGRRPLVRKLIGHPHASTELSDTAATRFPGAFHALKDLDAAYKGHAHEPFFVKVNMAKARSEVQAVGEDLRNAMYGEVQPMSFVQMLDSINATPGMKYYDLGSGMGKTVIMASLLGFNATGVELVGQRWKESCLALARARRRGLKHNHTAGADVRFEKASMMDIDLSGADIIFVNSALFTEDMMEKIAKHARFMKPGAKVISSNGLTGASFRDVNRFSAPTSYSDRSTWKIQEVVREHDGASLAATGEEKGKPLGRDPSKSCTLSDSEDAAAMLESSSFGVKLAASLISLVVFLNA